MFDAGTGSGILALAGSGFGAADVIGIDNDSRSIATAKENARNNKVRGVRFMAADVKTPLAGRFDIITANLYSELLKSVLGIFGRSLRVHGALILSGVLRQQESGLVRALRSHRFKVVEIRRRSRWIAVLCRKPS